MVELKQLALKCEFGVFLEEVLRDRLVCGLKNIQIQKKLLAERELTFRDQLSFIHTQGYTWTLYDKQPASF